MNEEATPSKQGVVFKKLLGRYTVQTDSRVIDCSISSRLRKELIYPTADVSSNPHQRVQAVKDIHMVDPVAIGDIVSFVEAGDGTGLIKEVLPRKNKLVRYAAGPKPLEQVIAANIDQMVLIVAAAQPQPKWSLLDRYLATAEADGIRALICITKMDLAKKKGLLETVQIYQEIGYPVLLTSVVTGQGIPEFKEALQQRVSALVGMSGVGKTSLLNVIQPGLGLQVKEISQATGKGTHTTTHLEMFPLDGGGSVVDTPGMKLLGLWDVEEIDLDSLFVEMRPYVGRCRFRLDCTHSHEPGCAIKEAVERGDISQLRYENYLQIRQDLKPKY
jgi:ribosome biogenesis GTPase